MALTLYFHPLSSYCQKVLIALYENATPFEPLQIDLGDPASRAKLTAHWPIGKFPVLTDGDHVVPESSIIIEYLDAKYPGPTRFIPSDPDLARQTRLKDRFYDCHIDDQLGRIATLRLRPEGHRDPRGMVEARARIETALAMVEKDMADKTCAMGDTFTLADCAAAPALFYADMVAPFAATHPNATAYLERLKARPSYARALAEAAPYLHMVPK